MRGCPPRDPFLFHSTISISSTEICLGIEGDEAHSAWKVPMYKWHQKALRQQPPKSEAHMPHASLTNHEKTYENKVSAAYFRFPHPTKRQQSNDFLCSQGLQSMELLSFSIWNSVRLQKDLQSAKRCMRWKAPSGPNFEEKCHAALCAWHSALGSKFCQVAKGLAECKALHTLKSTQRAKVWGKMPRSPVRLAFSSWQQILSGCKRTCRVQSAAYAEKHPAGQSLRKNATQPCAPGIQLLAANSVRLQKDLQSAKRCMRWKAPSGPKFEEKCHAALCSWHSALGSKFCQVAKGLAECKALHTLKSTQRAKVWGKMPRSPVRLAFSSWQQILSGCKRTCRVQSAAYAEKHPAAQSLRKSATQPCQPGIQLLAAFQANHFGRKFQKVGKCL